MTKGPAESAVRCAAGEQRSVVELAFACAGFTLTPCEPLRAEAKLCFERSAMRLAHNRPFGG